MDNSFELFKMEVMNINFSRRKPNACFWDSLSVTEQVRYVKFLESYNRNIKLMESTVDTLPNVKTYTEVPTEVPSYKLKYTLISFGMLIMGTCLYYSLALSTT